MIRALTVDGDTLPFAIEPPSPAHPSQPAMGRWRTLLPQLRNT
ncbi:iron-sulfur cluster assembly protein [Pontibaca salina]|nr:iron-sulfur cluster assembly protein [Pontibaca salina]